jgi:hypothetical protein
MTALAISLGIAAALASGWWWLTGQFESVEEFLSQCGLKNQDQEFWKVVRTLEPPRRVVFTFLLGVVIPALSTGGFVALCAFKLPELTLFAASILVGLSTWKHSRTLGTTIPEPIRSAARLNLSFCAFLSVWSLTTYVLWDSGVDLKLGSIASGRMQEAWWLGPASAVFATLTYALLRDGSVEGKRWPLRRSIGSVVLTLMAFAFLVLAWSKVSRQDPGATQPTEIAPGG